MARPRQQRPPPLPDVPRATVPDAATQRAVTAIITAIQSIIQFLRPYVQPEPWRYLLYETTWADYPSTSSFLRCAHRKDAMGRVHLRGLTQRSGGSQNVIGVLPVNYRPSEIAVFMQYDSAAGYGRVDVYPDGRVIYGGAAGAVDVSLDGISFDTEA